MYMNEHKQYIKGERDWMSLNTHFPIFIFPLLRVIQTAVGKELPMYIKC